MMGYQPSCDEGSSLQTHGYCAPTDKARRNKADGRARRVYAALAKPAPSPWVTAEFRPSRFGETTSNNSLKSPETLSRKQRASKLSLGFKCQILEQLAEDRTKVAQRLQTLAAACSEALETHSSPGGSGAGSPGASSPKHRGRKGQGKGIRADAQLAGKAASTPSSTPALAAAALRQLRISRTPTATASGGDSEHTPVRAPTPATSLRPAARTVAKPRGRHSSSPTSGRPGSSVRRGLAAAAAGPPPPASNALQTGNGATVTTAVGGFVSRGAAPELSDGTSGARRRLAYTDVIHDAAQSDFKSAESRTVFGNTAPSTPLTSIAYNVTDTASAKNAEMPYSEATGRRLAEVATLRVVEDAMGLGAALAVAAVTPTHGKTPLRLAWQEPVDLLPPGLLHNLIDVRDSILPHRQGTHTIRPVLPQMMSWGSSHLDHRERLRAGMAELNAELYSSWRALVDSGAI